MLKLTSESLRVTGAKVLRRESEKPFFVHFTYMRKAQSLFGIDELFNA